MFHTQNLEAPKIVEISATNMGMAFFATYEEVHPYITVVLQQ
jgi:hypothetical protein